MSNLTAEQKVMHMIIETSIRLGEFSHGFSEVTEDNVCEIYDLMVESDAHWDAVEEVRCGGVQTGTDSGYSRNFESYDVAMQYIDGSWVGWVYYFGGGKHAEPDQMPWISGAKNLTCTEEEVVQIKRTFTEIK